MKAFEERKQAEHERKSGKDRDGYDDDADSDVDASPTGTVSG